MPLRADAQRNYDAVIAAAREAFATRGTQASLDDIAEQAGVGNATLYRHFPTRDALIVETLRLPLAELAAIARELDPETGLREWFTEVVAQLSSWQGLPEAVAASLGVDSPLRTACQPLQLATFRLLTTAGSPADPDDVFALMLATAWSLGPQATEEQLARRVELVFTGLS